MTRENGGRGHMAFRLAMGILSVTAAASLASAQVATLEQRVEGAERVVVATVRTVTPEWRENRFGDRLIVSRFQLEVSETLKGGAASTVWMDMEGGTLDGFTLQVSTLPRMAVGERAVFFLDASNRGVHTPHMRGYGILPLDTHDVVRGTSLRLDEIRSRVRGGGR